VKACADRCGGSARVCAADLSAEVRWQGQLQGGLARETGDEEGGVPPAGDQGRSSWPSSSSEFWPCCFRSSLVRLRRKMHHLSTHKVPEAIRDVGLILASSRHNYFPQLRPWLVQFKGASTPGKLRSLTVQGENTRLVCGSGRGNYRGQDRHAATPLWLVEIVTPSDSQCRLWGFTYPSQSCCLLLGLSSGSRTTPWAESGSKSDRAIHAGVINVF